MSDHFALIDQIESLGERLAKGYSESNTANVSHDIAKAFDKVDNLGNPSWTIKYKGYLQQLYVQARQLEIRMEATGRFLQSLAGTYEACEASIIADVCGGLNEAMRYDPESAGWISEALTGIDYTLIGTGTQGVVETEYKLGGLVGNLVNDVCNWGFSDTDHRGPLTVVKESIANTFDEADRGVHYQSGGSKGTFDISVLSIAKETRESYANGTTTVVTDTLSALSFYGETGDNVQHTVRTEDIFGNDTTGTVANGYSGFRGTADVVSINREVTHINPDGSGSRYGVGASFGAGLAIAGEQSAHSSKSTLAVGPVSGYWESWDAGHEHEVK